MCLAKIKSKTTAPRDFTLKAGFFQRGVSVFGVGGKLDESTIKKKEKKEEKQRIFWSFIHRYSLSALIVIMISVVVQHSNAQTCCKISALRSTSSAKDHLCKSIKYRFSILLCCVVNVCVFTSSSSSSSAIHLDSLQLLSRCLFGAF